MTKKELIQQLKDFPDNAIVCIESENGGPAKVSGIGTGIQVTYGKKTTLIVLEIEEGGEEESVSKRLKNIWK